MFRLISYTNRGIENGILIIYFQIQDQFISKFKKDGGCERELERESSVEEWDLLGFYFGYTCVLYKNQ